MTCTFHPDALAEIDKAIDYYEECEAGLGCDFAVEVRSAIARAIAHPKAWPEIEGDIRRVLVRRFPYGILYAEDGGAMFVLAVMHLHRKPDYWQYRI